MPGLRSCDESEVVRELESEIVRMDLDADLRGSIGLALRLCASA
jgi:hypothetical protein